MTTLREAAQQALEALEQLQGGCTDSDDGTVEAITVWCPEVITALRTALAEPEQHDTDCHAQGICQRSGYSIGCKPEQEPVAWMHKKTDLLRKETNKPKGADWDSDHWTPLYTHPPQRKPLTDEEICHVVRYEAVGTSNLDIARAIERAHGIGGEA